MPTYTYKARDDIGKQVKGTIEGLSREEIVDKLRKMGYMTTFVTEVPAGIKIESIFEKLERISIEDMITFNIQLSNMINSGITVLASLKMLNKQIENKKLRDIIGDVSVDIEAGNSLYGAFSRYPRVFSKLFVNMVKAGEASGKLGQVLSRFAEYLERQEDLRQKIRGALLYPAILLLAGTAVTLFIVTYIIPQFVEIFLKAGIRLPVITLILYNIGMAIKRFWYIIILLVIFVWLVMRFYIKTENGRFQFDRFKLKLPIIGPLYRKVIISRFTGTLATLLEGGVSILESLNITREVMGNEFLARIIGNVRKSVERGESISMPLKITEEFPADMVQMIAVGEETGRLNEMLYKISDLYDRSLGYAIKKLITILEPLFLVIIGGMVGFIMASMLIPIFDMIKILRH